MSRERLDQILIRSGVAREDQIRQALMRQKTHGGRLGSHLLYYKFVSEAQLVRALEEQFGCPGVQLTGRTVPRKVTEKVPLRLMEAKGLFPFHFEAETRTLHLAMVDPDDQEAVLLVQQASMAREAKPYVAVEACIRKAINVHCHGRSWDDPQDEIVEMPDLFGDSLDPRPSEAAAAPAVPPPVAEPRQAVLVTRKSFLKTFLVPIFEREGLPLRIVCERAEWDTLYEGAPPERVLLSKEMEADFRDWSDPSAHPGRPAVPIDVTPFSCVSESLLDRTLPHSQVIESLLFALEQMAEMQCDPAGWKPPYGTMQEEAANLARALGMDRKGTEALRIATLLLVPAAVGVRAEAASGIDLTVDSFQNVLDSLNRARSAFAPWGVDACLRSFLDLLAGTTQQPLEASPEGEDAGAAPHILAGVWYRHLAASRGKDSGGTDPGALRAGLHALEARGVSPAVLEAYLHQLSRPAHPPGSGTRHDVFLLFKTDQVQRELATHLRNEGYRVLELKDVAEAKHLCNRKPPDIIVMHHDAFEEQSILFCREIKQYARTLLFAVTNQTRPSVLLRLLDSGYQDVFHPPFNLDLIATRIHNAVESMERRERIALSRKGFTGSFRQLPFVDLIQALSLSRRSVRIELEQEAGERACLYLRDGNLTHASCGELEAEPAVYRIIGWGEAGTFRLETVDAYPPANVHAPTDFVLLEGVRRLDEEAA